MGEEEEQSQDVLPEEMGEDEDGSKAKKRKERLEQNRISARESRKRKKTMIEELQRTVITLSRENKDLNERNEGLRRQLMEIGTKYPNVVPMQAIVGAPPTTMDQQQQQQAAAGGAAAPAAPPQAMTMAFPTIAYPPGMAPGGAPTAAYPIMQQPQAMQPAAPAEQQQQPQAMQPAAPAEQQQQQVAPAPAEGTK